ncbi:MAG: 5'-nucleotidase C-terminal domain-containing protein [bacterium]
MKKKCFRRGLLWLLVAVSVVIILLLILRSLAILDVFYWTQENVELSPTALLAEKKDQLPLLTPVFYPEALQTVQKLRGKNKEGSLLKYKNVFLAAGELLGGRDPMNIYYQGKPVAEALAAIGCDAFVPSRKEFSRLNNDKKAGDVPFAFHLPLTVSNGLYDSLQLKGSGAAQYRLVGVGAKKILLLGFIPPPDKAPAFVKEDLKRLRVLIRSVRCDFVILFAWTDDAAALAGRLPEVGLILTAQRPGATEKVQKPLSGQAAIAPWADSRFSTGKIRLIFFPFLKTPFSIQTSIPVKSTLPGDSNLHRIFAGYSKSYDNAFQGIPGKITSNFLALSEIPLSHKRLSFRESLMGDLLTDILRREMHTDLALLNHRAIREGTGRMIFLEDLARCLPFQNEICTLFFTGRQLDTLLRRNALENRRFLQFSGAQIACKPNDEQSAIIHIGGKPLVMERVYSVATNDYLALGARGREPLFAQAPGRRWTGLSLNFIISDYLTSRRWVGRPVPRTLICRRNPALEAAGLLDRGLKFWMSGEREQAIRCWSLCALIQGESFKLPSQLTDKLDPPAHHRLLGEVFDRSGLLDPALKEYRASAASGGDIDKIRSMAGMMLCREGRLESALDELTESVKKSRSKDTLWSLAVTRLGLGEYDQALSALAEPSAPQGEDALFFKGWLQLLRGDFQDSLLNWRKAEIKMKEPRLKLLIKCLLQKTKTNQER